MSNYKFQIGMAAVVLMVILRLSLGCHFFYEGVWKITHPEFTAEGFLLQAKGPAAGLFHAMVPDIDGRHRLKIERLLSGKVISDAWKQHRDDAERHCKLAMLKRQKEETSELSEEGKRELRRFRRASEKVLWDCEDKLETSLAKHEPDVLAYFAARKENSPPDKKQGLPQAIKALLSEIGGVEKEYHKALGDLVVKSVGGKNPSFSARVPLVDEGVRVVDVVAGNSILGFDGGRILRVEDGIKGSQYLNAWNDLKLAVINKYDLSDAQEHEVRKTYRRFKDSLGPYLAENRHDIAVYFEALRRFEERKASRNYGAAHQKERLYQEGQKLRWEVGVWLSDFEKWEDEYHRALWSVLTPEQREEGALPTPWTRTDLINFAVTYGLTAIGLCLFLGLFTRPAALAGGLFMFSVVLTQPAWPTIYPPDPPVVGHALLINKDFVEMIALFTLAATAVGRWGGLDYFVERYIVRCCTWLKNKLKKQEDKDESES